MTRETDLRRLVNQEANARLSSQISMICAADARAIGLMAASISLAGVSAAAAIAVRQVTGLDPSGLLQGLGSGATIVSMLAALAAGWAVQPTRWEMPGWAPGSFENDWFKTEDEVIERLLAVSHNRIAINTAVVQITTAKIVLSQQLLIMFPIGAVLGALLTAGEIGRSFAAAGIVAALFFVASRAFEIKAAERQVPAPIGEP